MVVFRKRTKMWVRPNTSDDFIVDEAIDYNNIFLDVKDNDVFMDIGSNIGSTISLAKSFNHTITCIGYEPEEENFKVLKLNTNHYNKCKIKKCAIGKKNGMTKFFTEKGTFKAKHSTKPRQFLQGFEEQIVKVKSFKNELSKYKPSLLKIDIEGGEYDLSLQKVPLYIKIFAIEFHLINDNWKDMFKLYNIISDQFDFKTGEIPKVNSLNWFKDNFKSDDAFMVIFYRNN